MTTDQRQESGETTSQPSTTLGQLLRDARQRRGLSRLELATRCGVDRSTLRRIEDGVIAQPTTETLNMLALQLGLDPETLYDARWQNDPEPLPSTTVYFRNKYDLSDQQLRELNRAVKRITGDKPASTAVNHQHHEPNQTERRSP